MIPLGQGSMSRWKRSSLGVVGSRSDWGGCTTFRQMVVGCFLGLESNGGVMAVD